MRASIVGCDASGKPTSNKERIRRYTDVGRLTRTR
jgi:hypothetical protein